jgi:ADP-ribose pyrophosphatase
MMEPSEDPVEAAARELAEETGYGGDLELITACFDDAYATTVRYCFVATNCRKAGDRHLDEKEFITVRLIDRDELLRIVRSGRMTDVEVAMLGLDRLGLLCT